jgi:hypothetical protein
MSGSAKLANAAAPSIDANGSETADDTIARPPPTGHSFSFQTLWYN